MALPAWICTIDRIEYQDAARLQRSLRAAREAGEIPDTILVLEHEPVITTGHRTEIHEVAHALTTGIPVVPTERGGKATWHGPGQIVAYPILDLNGHGSDIRAYVCALEQAVIDTCAEFGIDATRRPGLPGVWIEPRHDVTAGMIEGVSSAPHHKIASIGVRVTRWISFHGVALNSHCNLDGFAQFTPCGIGDVRMTSIVSELHGAAPSLATVRDAFSAHLNASLNLTCTPVPESRLRDIAEQFSAPEPDLSSVAERSSTCAAKGVIR